MIEQFRRNLDAITDRVPRIGEVSDIFARIKAIDEVILDYTAEHDKIKSYAKGLEERRGQEGNKLRTLQRKKKEHDSAATRFQQAAQEQARQAHRDGYRTSSSLSIGRTGLRAVREHSEASLINVEILKQQQQQISILDDEIRQCNSLTMEIRQRISRMQEFKALEADSMMKDTFSRYPDIAKIVQNFLPSDADPFLLILQANLINLYYMYLANHDPVSIKEIQSLHEAFIKDRENPENVNMIKNLTILISLAEKLLSTVPLQQTQSSDAAAERLEQTTSEPPSPRPS